MSQEKYSCTLKRLIGINIYLYRESRIDKFIRCMMYKKREIERTNKYIIVVDDEIKGYEER